MSFLKTKKFWIPFSVVGVGIVTIGTGVGIHQRNQNAINIYEGNSRGEIRTKLRNALETINANDIRVNLNPSNVIRKSLTQTISDSGLYAFNVSSNQLGLSSNVSIPSGIQISFELDKDKNTLQTLNNGVLNIKLVATTPFSDEKQTRDIALSTFKKADTNLSSLLVNTNNESVLEIKNKQEDKTYRTIEQLNSSSQENTSSINQSISGLSALLRNSMNNDGQIQNQNLSIEGTVKLEKMQVEGEKLYFYLTSSNPNESLKLVNKQANNSTEILFNKVKLTNLAASEIVVVPNGYSSYKSFEFGKGLDEGKLVWKIDQDASSNPKHSLLVKPYYLQQRTDTTNTNVGIQVRFGIDENAKIYDTNRLNELAILKNAGFSFNVFSMKASKMESNLKLSELTTEKMKLAMLFKDKNFNMPSMKITDSCSQFKTTSIQNASLARNTLIPTNGMMSKSGRNNTPNKTASKDNWILFSDYSYKGIDMNNVLLTPAITIVHLDRNIIPPMMEKSTK